MSQEVSKRWSGLLYNPTIPYTYKYVISRLNSPSTNFLEHCWLVLRLWGRCPFCLWRRCFDELGDILLMEEIRRSPPGMVLKKHVNSGINHRFSRKNSMFCVKSKSGMFWMNIESHRKTVIDDQKISLLGSNMYPPKGTIEDNFPFPAVGYVSSQEGNPGKDNNYIILGPILFKGFEASGTYLIFLHTYTHEILQSHGRTYTWRFGGHKAISW